MVIHADASETPRVVCFRLATSLCLELVATPRVDYPNENRKG